MWGLSLGRGDVADIPVAEKPGTPVSKSPNGVEVNWRFIRHSKTMASMGLSRDRYYWKLNWS